MWTYIICLYYHDNHSKKVLSKSDNPQLEVGFSDIYIQIYDKDIDVCTEMGIILFICVYVMAFNIANGELHDCATLGILIGFVAYFSTLYSYSKTDFIKQIIYVLKLVH